ncbi:Ubiquinol cytochrome c reductase assembly protein CBP3 [Phaffia rhodozyma]|uniref:Ubiquinol cytochrome c reductase assembly protein CBP3 n=1 Tax=Phaffia rhodozyma TaxID=264483 RepID=A0A0F7SX60_PHARH|nr:Ubiquinol cytochrome c reductase assembly protein CBP3 [Phaffia rhodozyma]
MFSPTHLARLLRSAPLARLSSPTHVLRPFSITPYMLSDSPSSRRIDPSLYIGVRPNSLPGLPPPSGIKYHPLVMKFLSAFVKVAGSNSTSKAIDGTRYILGQACDGLERNEDFFWEECKLPPTFQSYFQTQSLIILIHMVRIRSLPAAAAESYQKEILAHFFSLLDTRMRRTLGPRTPESLIKKYIRDLGEQWVGTQFSFDVGICGTDHELAGYVWRNVFAGRGIEQGTYGIKIPQGDASKRQVKSFKIGRPDGMGGVIREQDVVPKIGGEGRIGPVPTTIESPPMMNELPAEWDPLSMVDEISEIVGFIRREVTRLESIPDNMILDGFVGNVGPVRAADAKIWEDIMREEADKVIKEKGQDWLPTRQW